MLCVEGVCSICGPHAVLLIAFLRSVVCGLCNVPTLKVYVMNQLVQIGCGVVHTPIIKVKWQVCC